MSTIRSNDVRAMAPSLRHAACVLLTCAAAQSALAGASFYNIGLLPGGTSSGALGVSLDGSVVVGSASSASGINTPFRWTPAGGKEVLGGFSDHAAARAISSDGSTFVGSTQNQAYKWTSAGGRQDLGAPSGWTSTTGQAVNADGSVVVGVGVNSRSQYGAYRYTSSGGMQDLGGYPGGFSARAWGVSGNGSVVVGQAADSSFNTSAFRWTEATGMQSLGHLPDRVHSIGRGVSYNGAVVVGDDSDRAFRWTAEKGMQDLGVLSSMIYSFAFATNDIGTMVVGHCDDSNVSTLPRAFLWTTTRGMVDLNIYLPAIGVNLTGWTLTGAYSISGDGSTIVGIGKFNGKDTAWAVTNIPAPGAAALLGAAIIVAPRRRR